MLHSNYDTSKAALENFATGNPHFDCMKYGRSDSMFLCYLARDRDPDSAEAALDRLRSLLDPTADKEDLLEIYRTATLVRLGHDSPTLRAAACDLLQAMERRDLTPAQPE